MVLINQRCMKLPPPAALLCWASKFGISGDGRGCWDHAAFVLRDTKTDVPYLLEGGTPPRHRALPHLLWLYSTLWLHLLGLSGATLRTYEERLLQNGGYREEMTLLPLHRAGSKETGRAGSPADLARVDALLAKLSVRKRGPPRFCFGQHGAQQASPAPEAARSGQSADQPLGPHHAGRPSLACRRRRWS